ncbi:MAG: hypothetical protein HXY34_01975 [Candidatus Thorarchaeota archaeon]|nr:hypothetical protein [Candidatus Thorarchaeota archaeon]
MSSFELIKQAMLGNVEERLPVAIWMHHPERDRTAEGLAHEEVSVHREFNHDLLKVSFHGRYPVVDWGCVAAYDGRPSGSTHCESCAVTSVEDWETLEPLDVNTGEFGKQLRAMEMIAAYASDRVPTMATVFDPAMVADKLCEEKLVQYIESHPDVMRHTLDLITDVMIDFARAVLEAGSYGLFIASQHSTKTAVSDRDYREFVLPYQEKMLSRLSGKAKFIVVHLHTGERGEEVRFDLADRTHAVDALNWEDQTAVPTLAEGKARLRRTVLGGVDQQGLLRTGTVDDIKAQVLDTIRQTRLKRLIVSPGCVIPVDTPRDNIRAVVDAVRSIKPWSKEWEAYV